MNKKKEYRGLYLSVGDVVRVGVHLGGVDGVGLVPQPLPLHDERVDEAEGARLAEPHDAAVLQL